MADQKVTKAVIAAAGFGTRFLPQTKAMPKEMLPIVDKPVIQYIVEQLVDAGIEDIIIVSGYSKRAIEDHFDQPNEDLLANLRAGGPSKAHYISEIERLGNLANFAYVRQKGPYGTATPVLNAAHLLGNEPFIYTFADDITIASPNPFKQMIGLYDELQASIAQCLQVENDVDFDRYGILAGKSYREGVLQASGIVEKPGRAAAPSNFAVTAGYLLTADVFKYIEAGLRSLPEGKEFYLSDDVLQPMMRAGNPLYGLQISDSIRYDTGNTLGYLKAVVDFALQREDLGPEFRQYLQDILQ